MSGWNRLGPYVRILVKPLGTKLFCTLEKKKLNTAFSMLNFPDPQNLQFLCLLWHGEKLSHKKSQMKKYSQESQGESALRHLFQRNPY